MPEPAKQHNLIDTLRTSQIKTPGIISLLSARGKFVLIFISCYFFLSIAHGQKSDLFDSDEILEFTLRGDLKTAFKDRGDDPGYHKVILHYEEDQKIYDIPLRMKARGNFRKSLAGCSYPPLFLNFKKSVTPKSSIFRDQDKTKLVTPCRGDEFVVHEYLVYKLYNLITPNSFRARLVKVVYEDTVKNKSSDPYFGMLLEEEKQLAKRNKLVAFEKFHVSPKKTEYDTFLKMAVFQYLIGNTDWSIQYMQNIKFIAKDTMSIPITVPYDFDHAGIVRTPYSKPAPELELSSTLNRMYRGYCLTDINQLNSTFEMFNNLKDEIYSIYSENPHLSEKYIKQTLKFLDRFYETINDPKAAKREFLYPCDPNGKGNVIIKGLNAD